MKQLTFSSFLLAVFLLTGAGITSCKNKAKNTPETRVDTPANLPVDVNSDDALRKGAQDATKDYPGVTATVNNGEVTLTGTIDRDRLPNLLSTINSLNPRKVNNQLTFK